MIPILYKKDDTNYTRNGAGFLTDVISCDVTEERNGAYEMTFEYPATGLHYSDISEGVVIKAKANETSDLQLFRIYAHSKPINGIVTFSAEHISYDANGIPLIALTAKSTTPQAVINKAIREGAFESSFTAWSDISTLNSIDIAEPCSLRAALGGQQGSVLDVWGGEYEFDNYTIKLHAHRGADRGVTIEYGKNLTDIQQERNITETYTHILPYAMYTERTDDGSGGMVDNDIIVTLSEKVLPLIIAENVGHQKAAIINLSEMFRENEDITEQTLRNKANSYIAAHEELGIPKVNIQASFVSLWQTEEYKDIAPLERVQLCDTVTVRFVKLGISAKAKVIKTVYDALNEKYKSVELGEARSSFADTMLEQEKAITELVTVVRKGFSNATEELKRAIAEATALITGNSGGYVVLHPAEHPQEILIMDTPDMTTAVRVWRWNSAGLGYSSTGYNGEFGLAMTMNGAIVADFITAGTLNGGLLRADSVEANAISAGFKQQIADSISGAKETVEQEFALADEQLRSSITTSYTDTISASESRIQTLIQQTRDEIMLDVYTKTETGNLIDGAIADANYYTDDQLGGYYTKSETEGKISASADGLTASFNTKLSNDYYTKTETDSRISVSKDGILAIVSKAQSKYDTSNHTIQIYGYGTPASQGYDASDYPGQQYLDQNNGYLYFSNSKSWVKDTTLKLITTTLQSQITQNATNISLKVAKGDVVSEINQSADTISLKAGRLIITTGNFQLDANGNATMTNATMTGSVTSGGTSGYRTKITSGQIETYYDNKRVSVIVPVKIGNIVRTGFLASTNYHGLMFGRVYNDTINSYYYINLDGDGYDQYGCRHYFVGDVKFTSGSFKSPVNFSNNYGVAWGGNTGLRYRDSDSTSDVGLWLGITANSCDTYVTAGGDVHLQGRAVKHDANSYFYKNVYIENAYIDIANDYGITCGGNSAFRWASSNSAVCVGISNANLRLYGSAVLLGSGSTAVTSDERKKKDIAPLAYKYLQLVKNITPVSYKYTDDISLSGRNHTGFIAQDVLQAMTAAGIDTSEFAGFVDVNGDGSEYALRYEEFIPPLLAYVKHLEGRITALEVERSD